MWRIRESDLSVRISHYISQSWAYFNIRMWFNFFDFILKVHRTVTNNICMFYIRFLNCASTAHVNRSRNEFILFRIDDRVSMYRYEYFVTFAVDSYAVVEVGELVARSKLNVYIFAYTRWNHAFLVVFYLEKWRGWR